MIYNSKSEGLIGQRCGVCSLSYDYKTYCKILLWLIIYEMNVCLIF